MKEAAPPYAGEGAHALWHVSEDASITASSRVTARSTRWTSRLEPVELRVVPTLLPLWESVLASTLDYSGIRLRNAVRP